LARKCSTLGGGRITKSYIFMDGITIVEGGSITGGDITAGGSITSGGKIADTTTGTTGTAGGIMCGGSPGIVVEN